MKYGQRAVIGKMCIIGNASHGTLKARPRSLADTKLTYPCIQPSRRTLGSSRPCGRARPTLIWRIKEVACPEPHVRDYRRHRAILKVHTDFKTYDEMYRAHDLMHEKSIMTALHPSLR